jgi:hypothetical protein
MLQLFLGQIPEAIYFALFMIFTKKLKEKRILFIILLTLEYILLLRIMPFSIYAHIGFFVMTYIIMKILYKEKSQIIDVFTLSIASIILMISSMICYLTFSFNTMLATIINRIVIFIFLFTINYKLNKIQGFYKKIWNRNKNKTKIKSTTFRSINVVIFNIMFYVINICMLYALFLLERK